MSKISYKQTACKNDGMSDKSICFLNDKGTKCYAYRQVVDNEEKINGHFPMSTLEYKKADEKLMASLLLSNKDIKDPILSSGLFEEFSSGKVVDLKGYYSTSNERIPAGQGRICDKGLAAKLKKNVLAQLSKEGYTWMILHAAGGDDLVNRYQRNGMHCVKVPLWLLDSDISYYNEDTFAMVNVKLSDVKSKFNECKNRLKQDDIGYVVYEGKEYGGIQLEPNNICYGRISDMMRSMESLPIMQVEYSKSNSCNLDSYEQSKECISKIGGKEKSKANIRRRSRSRSKSRKPTRSKSKQKK